MPTPSDIVKADYSGMLNASSGFKASAAKLEQTMGDLDTRLNNLLAVFTGNAATAFRLNHSNLDSGFDDMRAVVAQLGIVVEEAQQAYQAADQHASTLFSTP